MRVLAGRSVGLHRIVNPHLGSDTFRELLCDPALGELTAHALGAVTVQAWGSEVVVKQPDDGGATVGWHRDAPYFAWWEGPVVTLWIALTPVDGARGAIRYIAGSHRWAPGPDDRGFDEDEVDSRQRFAVPDGRRWEETTVSGPVGTMTLHLPDTIHGSGPNRSEEPRAALALRLRTGEARVRPGAPRGARRAFGDPEQAPVLFPSGGPVPPL